jgi:hypothetical protein
MAPVTPAISKKTSDKRFSNGLCIIKLRVRSLRTHLSLSALPEDWRRDRVLLKLTCRRERRFRSELDFYRGRTLLLGENADDQLLGIKRIGGARIIRGHNRLPHLRDTNQRLPACRG